MYSTRSYVKNDGTTGYELYNTLTEEVLYRDSNFAKVNEVKRKLDVDEALGGEQ